MRIVPFFIGERERRLLHMAPGSPEATPTPEITEALAGAEQLHISPDNPVDMQAQVINASTQRSTQAVKVEFGRRDQVAANLQRQYDGLKMSGALDSYEGRTREWIDATNASLNGRYTVGIRNGEVRLYPTGSAPMETSGNALPPKAPMAPNRPSPVAPNAPEKTPPAAPEKGASAPKTAAEAPDGPNEPFDPVKGEGAPEGEKPAAGLDGEIPKEDQENLKKLAENMLEGQDPSKMTEKQKNQLVGRVQMNTGVGVVEKGNKFEPVAPKTNMERLMNVIAGVVLFVQAIFNKNETKEGSEKNEDIGPKLDEILKKFGEDFVNPEALERKGNIGQLNILYKNASPENKKIIEESAQKRLDGKAYVDGDSVALRQTEFGKLFVLLHTDGSYNTGLDHNTLEKEELKPSTTTEQRKENLTKQMAEGKTAEQLAADIAAKVQKLEGGDLGDPKVAQELTDLRADAYELKIMVAEQSATTEEKDSANKFMADLSAELGFTVTQESALSPLLILQKQEDVQQAMRGMSADEKAALHGSGVIFQDGHSGVAEFADHKEVTLNINQDLAGIKKDLARVIKEMRG